MAPAIITVHHTDIRKVKPKPKSKKRRKSKGDREPLTDHTSYTPEALDAPNVISKPSQHTFFPPSDEDSGGEEMKIIPAASVPPEPSVVSVASKAAKHTYFPDSDNEEDREEQREMLADSTDIDPPPPIRRGGSVLSRVSNFMHQFRDKLKNNKAADNKSGDGRSVSVLNASAAKLKRMLGSTTGVGKKRRLGDCDTTTDADADAGRIDSPAGCVGNKRQKLGSSNTSTTAAPPSNSTAAAPPPPRASDAPIPYKPLWVEGGDEDIDWAVRVREAAPVKYWKQRYRLFSKFDCGVRMDHEGWFSVTPESIAQHIADRCVRSGGGGGGIVILDCFAGCGGNAIQFALAGLRASSSSSSSSSFSNCVDGDDEYDEGDSTAAAAAAVPAAPALGVRVIAVDIDEARLACARHNARVYGVEDRIEFILGDCLQIMPRVKADVIFLSPPWGGPEYLQESVFDIETMITQPTDGMSLFRAARAVTPNVVYFLPRNVAPDQVEALGQEVALMTSRSTTGLSSGSDSSESSSRKEEEKEGAEDEDENEDEDEDSDEEGEEEDSSSSDATSSSSSSEEDSGTGCSLEYHSYYGKVKALTAYFGELAEN